MSLARLTSLDGEAILPIVEAKEHLRILNSAEDDTIAALRDAAVGHIERVSGIAMAPTEYRWTLRNFPTRIDLPILPVTELGDVNYLDSDGAEQPYADARLVGSAVYAAAGGSWPTAYGYAAVTFTAGLAIPTEAPELLTAAKLYLEVLNDRGRSPVEVLKARERAVEALIDTYRAILV